MNFHLLRHALLALIVGTLAACTTTKQQNDPTPVTEQQAHGAGSASRPPFVANVPTKSRWVAEIIRKYAAHEWPKDCLELAGRFADFPLRDAGVAQGQSADVSRLGF